MITRALISLGLLGASVLAWRWGMGVSSPEGDTVHILRVIGYAERLVTRLDAWLCRVRVRVIDRLELDRVAWLRLRAQYTPEMS